MYIYFFSISLLFIFNLSAKANDIENCVSEILSGLVPPEALESCLKEQKQQEEKNKKKNLIKGSLDKEYRNIRTHPEAPFNAPKQINIPRGLSMTPGKYRVIKSPSTYTHIFVYGGSKFNPDGDSRSDVYISKIEQKGDIRTFYELRRYLQKNVGRHKLKYKLGNLYIPTYDSYKYEINCQDYTSKIHPWTMFSYKRNKKHTGFNTDGYNSNQKIIKIEGRQYFALPQSPKRILDWDNETRSSTFEGTWGRENVLRKCQW